MASHGKLGELLAGLEQRSKGVKDSSSDTSGSTSVTARMQHVLQLLFDDYLKTEKVNTAGEGTLRSRLLSSLRLLGLALDKFRGVFYKDGNSSLPFYYARTTELLAIPVLRAEQKSLVRMLERLVSEAVSHEGPAFALICTGTSRLLNDIAAAVQGVAEGTLPRDAQVILECFAGARLNAPPGQQQQQQQDGEDKEGKEEGDCGAAGHCSSIVLASEQGALELAGVCAQMLVRCFEECPLRSRALVPSASAAALASLLKHAPTSVQVPLLEALQMLCRDLCPLPLSVKHSGRLLLDSLEHLLDLNTPATHDQNGKDEAVNFAEGRRSWQWWTGFATASELMVWRLAEAGELQREAPRCVELLRRATHTSLEETGDADFRIQASLLASALLLAESRRSVLPTVLGCASKVLQALRSSASLALHHGGACHAPLLLLLRHSSAAAAADAEAQQGQAAATGPSSKRQKARGAEDEGSLGSGADVPGCLGALVRTAARPDVESADGAVGALSSRLECSQVAVLGVLRAANVLRARAEAVEAVGAWMEGAAARASQGGDQQQQQQPPLSAIEVLGVIELLEAALVSELSCVVTRRCLPGKEGEGVLDERFQGAILEHLSVLELPWSPAAAASQVSTDPASQQQQQQYPDHSLPAAAKRSAIICGLVAWACLELSFGASTPTASASSSAAQRGAELLAEVAGACQVLVRRSLADSHEAVRAAAMAAVPLVALDIGTGKDQHGPRMPRARGALRLLAGGVKDESMLVRAAAARSLATLQDWVSSPENGSEPVGALLLHLVQTHHDVVTARPLGPVTACGAERRSVLEAALAAVPALPQPPPKQQDPEQLETAPCCGFTSSDLVPFEDLLTDNNERPQVLVEMLGVLSLWLRAGQPSESLRACRHLVGHGLSLASSPSVTVRNAVAELIIPFIASPEVLVHVFPSQSGNSEVPSSSSSGAAGKDSELKLLKGLREQVERAKGSHRSSGSSNGVHESLLCCIAQVCASAQTREALWMGLVMLVDALDDVDPAVKVTAAEMLHAVALRRGASASDMVTGQPRIMEYVGRRLRSKPALLTELADTIEIPEGELAQKLIPAVLPRLVISQDMELLEALASRLGLSMRDMLVNYGHHTVAFILLEGGQNIDDYAAFMFEHTEVEFDHLMRSSIRSVLREVVWCAGDERRWLQQQQQPPSLDEAPPSRGARQPPPELLRNMQQNVLGCIIRIHMAKDIQDSEINSAVADFLHEEQMVWLLTDLVGERMKRADDMEASEQSHALRCLALLVMFIDMHLADFVPLVMTLLARALELPALEVRLQALAVWALFVRQLSVHATEMLKINAVRIAVILSSSLDDSSGAAQGGAIKVMEELVLNNQEGLNEIFCELPPLPSVPALEKVNGVISKARGELSPPHAVQALAHGLVPFRPGYYAAQPLAVRAVTLTEMKRFLQSHREWQDELAIKGKKHSAWHSSLNFLVAVLLKSCDPEVRSTLSYRVQLQCGECLGTLGAIDPAKLEGVDSLKANISNAQAAAMLCGSERLLAVEVLKSLARLLSGSSDLQVLESATFGIQELLSHFGKADPDPMEEDRWTLFNAAGEQLQPVLRPYLSTKYQLEQSFKRGAIASPIFGTQQLSFRRWLFLWLKQLTDYMLPERSMVFRACTGVSRHDIPIMMLLLPHAILTVVTNGDDSAAKELVLAEFSAVLETLGSRVETNQVDWQLFLQAIFTLLDKLGAWSSRVEVERGRDNPGGASRTPSAASSPSAGPGSFSDSKDAVDEVLNAINQRALAKAAHRCGAHARALVYFEAALEEEGVLGLNPLSRRSSEWPEEDVSFLISIYSELEEPDGLSGLIHLRQGGLQSSDLILVAERNGAWGEALTLREQALQQDAVDSAAVTSSSSRETLTANQTGHLDCLLRMGHLQAVLTQVEGLAVSATGTARNKLATRAVAAAWRLGRWDSLEDALKVIRSQPGLLDADAVWEMRLGEILMGIRRRESTAVTSQIKSARHEIMGPMSAAAMESHSRAYPHVVRLHMLQEVEDAVSAIPGLVDSSNGSRAPGPNRLRMAVQQLHWKERLACTQVSLATQEPILALRRQLASLSGLKEEGGQCWLLLARLCRKTGHVDTASIACLEAVRRNSFGSELEYAKLLWQKGESRAINLLQEAIARGEPAAGATRIRTKLLLQLARWMSETGQGGREQVIGHFRNAIRSDRHWEKNFFYLGKYLDELMEDAKGRQTASEFATAPTKDRLDGKSKVALGEEQHHHEILPEVLENYALSLKHGHKLIMQSLPRLLTLWYDFGKQQIQQPSKGGRGGGGSSGGGGGGLTAATARKVAEVMEEAAGSIPVYSWLMVLSQLISRTCHPNSDVAGLTRDIIASVTEQYPRQAFWALVAVSRSKYKQRSKAAAEILNRAKKNIMSRLQKAVKAGGGGGEDQGSHLRDLFNQFPMLVDQLINIANYIPEGRVKRFDLTRTGGLGHVTRMNPTEVILPVLETLTPELPPEGSADQDHNAYLGREITITSINKEVEVMQSLQKPKKIIFKDSNMALHMFLAKPKDDLRKDQRLMEMATALNRLFAKDPASRRRNLYLRTYNVVPLTEDCGIIEWVPHTTGLRHCCTPTYTALHLFHKHTLGQIKQVYDRHDKQQVKKWTAWYNEITEMFPPVLHKWFLKVFSSPGHWFNARLKFTRTTAVWSMVGHILGLGDRHGENLLIDRSTGDCVHVDFDCLFDKGLTLQKPEMVPFRLTQNVVDAFGPSGIEGVFRSACGITLQVLRTHRETILSILETFVHDPLVDWEKSLASSGSRGGGGAAGGGTGDSENPQARDALRSTEGRLNGTLIGVSSRPSIALSCEGHANRLIEEAIDKENLGRMYVWWMVWF